ncbi:hypothetical protein SBY92_004790 [Candida maltosa Xu316]
MPFPQIQQTPINHTSQQQKIELENSTYIRNFTNELRRVSEPEQPIENNTSFPEPPTIDEETESINDDQLYYSVTEIRELLQDNTTSNEMRFEYFIELSDYFRNRAHKDVSTLPLDTYYKFIKLSLKCLTILDKRHSLDMNQKFLVYYKLAQIYIEETENLEIGEKYLNQAIALSSNLNDLKNMFNCELMVCHLIEKVNPKTLINYLIAKIQFYQEKRLNELVDCLELIKIKYNLVHNPDTALSSLTLLIGKTQNQTIKAFCLIQSANLHLHRASPVTALDLINHAGKIIEDNNIESLKLSLLMAQFVAYIHLNKDSKKIIGKVSKFVGRDDNANGKIELSIDVPKLDHTFRIDFDWITTGELAILAHLLTGVALLSDSRNKAKICFEKALKNLSKVEKSNKLGSMSLDEYVRKSKKLKYLRVLIKYYQTINNFVISKYTIDPLNEFMQSTHKEMDESDYIIIKGFYRMIYYCFAMYYHHNADLQAAKYYYLKVIESNKAVNPRYAAEQLSLGIPCESISPVGKFDELSVYANLNLVILLHFETDKLKQNTPSYLPDIKNQCLNNLEEAFKQSETTTSNTFNLNFTSNSDILFVTYNFILKIVLSSGIDLNFQTKIEQLLSKLGPKSSFAFLGIILMYVLNFKNQDHLSVFKDRLKDEDTEDICKLLISKGFMKHFKEVGEHDKAYLASMQYDQCVRKLQGKFDFLLNNIVEG